MSRHGDRVTVWSLRATMRRLGGAPVAQDQERQLLDPTRRILPLASMYAMGGGLRVASA